MNAIKAIRGMNDILPAEVPVWQHIENQARMLLHAYGYEEIRPPIVEKSELFQRSIGEVTDIVEKEMYTFIDRGGDSLSLRPECTASCVRAAIQNGLLRTPIRRLWAMGPMFRHERPQKGRYRQFHQIDAELFGIADPSAEAELILLSARLWQNLGLANLRLEINSLGTRVCQRAYRRHLIEYFARHRDALDEDCLRRLESNPLRILDSKNPAMRTLVEAAPKLVDALDEVSAEHFDTLRAMLDDAGITYVVNARLVRGLDYYTGTVFEWITDELGAQGAVCGGGRYDTLVEEIGGPSTPAIGFAIGLERLVALLGQHHIPSPAHIPHCYLAAVGERAGRVAHGVAERLRDRLPKIRLLVDAGPGSFKSKLKRANRSQARLALLLGDDEVRDSSLTIKDLRESVAQDAIALEEIGEHLEERLFNQGS